jgi:hypothetical protein
LPGEVARHRALRHETGWPKRDKPDRSAARRPAPLRPRHPQPRPRPPGKTPVPVVATRTSLHRLAGNADAGKGAPVRALADHGVRAAGAR